MRPLYLFALSMLAAFAASALITWYLTRRLADSQMTGMDMNKPGKPVLPTMGGVAVVLSFALAINIVLFSLDHHSPAVYASIFASLGAAFVGILDDVLGMRQRTKAFLPFLLAIPLGIVASDTTIYFPLLGDVDFGWLMVFLIPFGITCAANASNMLEGFNGLGAGMSLIISVTLIVISVMVGKWLPLLLLVPLAGALAGFLVFNVYPAKIFPGDTLTLFTGAVIASAAIIGDMKLAGALLFLPMIAEFFLKARGRFKAECWGKVDEKGNLHYEGRTESLTHIVMKWGILREWELVLVFWLWEIALSVAVIALVYARFIM